MNALIAQLHEVLIAAKRADQSGTGFAEERLQQVRPLIMAVEKALREYGECEREARELMASLRLQTYMPSDPVQGSEPIAHRWIVSKPERFHRAIEALRARFPDLSEFR